MNYLSNDNKYLKRIYHEIDYSLKRKVTAEQIEEMMEEQVFSHPDFKRHVLEVSMTLQFPKDKVEYVLRHHFLTIAKQMALITRIRRRLSIYCFCMIEIYDSVNKTLNHEDSYFIKLFGKRETKKIFSIFNY